MIMLIHYRCENCDEVYEDRSKILKCKICERDLCEYCQEADYPDICCDCPLPEEQIHYGD